MEVFPGHALSSRGGTRVEHSVQTGRRYGNRFTGTPHGRTRRHPARVGASLRRAPPNPYRWRPAPLRQRGRRARAVACGTRRRGPAHLRCRVGAHGTRDRGQRGHRGLRAHRRPCGPPVWGSPPRGRRPRGHRTRPRVRGPAPGAGDGTGRVPRPRRARAQVGRWRAHGRCRAPPERSRGAPPRGTAVSRTARADPSPSSRAPPASGTPSVHSACPSSWRRMAGA